MGEESRCHNQERNYDHQWNRNPNSIRNSKPYQKMILCHLHVISGVSGMISWEMQSAMRSGPKTPDLGDNRSLRLNSDLSSFVVPTKRVVTGGTM